MYISHLASDTENQETFRAGSLFCTTPTSHTDQLPGHSTSTYNLGAATQSSPGWKGLHSVPGYYPRSTTYSPHHIVPLCRAYYNAVFMLRTVQSSRSVIPVVIPPPPPLPPPSTISVAQVP